MMTTARISVLAAGLLCAATSASALSLTSETIDFGTVGATGLYFEDGFTVDAANINVSSSCVAGACMVLNAGSAAWASVSASGPFKFYGLSFDFNGALGNNGFNIYADVGPLATITAATHGASGTVYFAETIFAALSFEKIGGGTARIDDIMVNAVPLPAAGGMLLAGLGVFGALRRRKGK